MHRHIVGIHNPKPLAIGIGQAVVERAPRHARAPWQAKIEIVEIAFGQRQDGGHMLGTTPCFFGRDPAHRCSPDILDELKTAAPDGPAVCETGCAGERRRYAALRSRTSTMVASEESPAAQPVKRP